MLDPTRLESLFHVALELGSAAQRAAFLSAECASDPELQLAVERLLNAHFAAGSFLDELPSDVIPTANFPSDCRDASSDSVADDLLGKLIGPYKLLEVIGKGGMGVVYMADQLTPIRRRVALKAIKPGLDSRQVIARFEAERQALAMMDHPNIARVLDAGTTPSGRPYFVMELVRGLPITDYCEANGATLQLRLELFTRVCQAVQHAHMKGIIHRDLKPTNVLITLHDGVPVPKVIDFGIAKAIDQQLTEKTLFTNFAQFIGTPLYMSPEQAEMSGLDIDTRADVYSLGVLLYELLTATTPFSREQFERAGFEEIRRIIREVEPERPSTRIGTSTQDRRITGSNRPLDARQLSQVVRGELDWIVMKSLEKDRQRRYETASGLAIDIQHYLTDQPVEARPPSTIYRCQKFVRRNRMAISIATILAGTMLMATIVSTWLAIRANSAERQADKLAREATRSSVQAFSESRRADEAAREAEAKAREAAIERSRAEQKSQEATSSLQRERELNRRNYRLAYVFDMQAAQKAWEAGQTKLVTALLDQYDSPGPGEDVRGWEWHYLRRQCQSDLRRFVSNQGGILSVACHPSERICVTGGQDGSVKAWDIDTAANLATARDHSHPVRYLLYSPSGRLLVSASLDNQVIVRESSSGAILWSKEIGGWTSPQFSANGQELIFGCTDMKTPPIPDSIRFYSAQSGDLLRTQNLPAFGKPVERAMSMDGRFVLAWGRLKPDSEMNTFVDDLLTGVRRQLSQYGLILGTSFSPDGQTVAISNEESGIELWNMETGDDEHVSLDSKLSIANTLAFSLDGQRLASSINGLDGATSEGIQIWNVDQSWQHQILLKPSGRISGIAFNRDGSRLISSSHDGSVHIADVRLQSQVRLDPQAATLDGRYVATIDEAVIQIFNAETKQRVQVLAGHTRPIVSIEFSSSGQTLASTAHDGLLKLWNPITGRELHSIVIALRESGRQQEPLDNPLSNPLLRFRGDGQKVLVVGSTGAMKVFNVATGSECLSIKADDPPIACVCADFSPNGEFIAVGRSDGVALYDGQSGQLQTVLKRQLSNRTHQVAFTYDSQFVASSNDDATITLWNLATGTVERTFSGHLMPTTHLAFSIDGRRMVSAEANRIRVWDIESGAELGEFPATRNDGDENVTFLSIANNGKRIVAGVGEPYFKGSLRIFDATPLTDDQKTAAALVSELFEQHLLAETVLKHIEERKDWPESLRSAATEYANHYLRRDQLLDVTWKSAYYCDRNDRTLARRTAEALYRGATHDRRYVRLLAFVHNIEGDVSETLSLLEETSNDDLDGLIIKALAQRKLGDQDGFRRTAALVARHPKQNASDLSVETMAIQQHLDSYRQSGERRFWNKEWIAAVEALSVVADLRRTKFTHRKYLADALAMLGRWREAADILARDDGSDDLDFWETRRLALFELAAGNEVAYRAGCKRLLANCDRRSPRREASLVALACSVGDADLEDMETVVEQAQEDVEAHPHSSQCWTAWGMALFRNEETSDAIEILRKALCCHFMASVCVPERADEMQSNRLHGETALVLAYCQQGNWTEVRQHVQSINRLIEYLDRLPSEKHTWEGKLAILLSQRELARITIPEEAVAPPGKHGEK